MALYKIPVLLIIAVSVGISLWLVLQPSTARESLIGGLDRSKESFAVEVTKRSRSVPLWAVRLWGLFSLGALAFTIWAVVFLVD